MEGNKHVQTAQRMPSGKKDMWKENQLLFKQSDLYVIPESLIKEIFMSLNQQQLVSQVWFL